MLKPMLPLLLLMPAVASAQDFTPDRLVVYKTVGDVELNLHVFAPEDSDPESIDTKDAPIKNNAATEGADARDFPTKGKPKKSPRHNRSAIVFFFGGGWVGGSPTQFYPQSRALSQRGMIAFSAEYRTKGAHNTTPFECVKDGKSAIRWVRQHAAELGVDPDRIVAAGGSAGGHVAACTGMIEGYEEDGDDTSISSIPNALILFNPVLDTTKKGYGAKRFKPAQRMALSPCHHVRGGIVPTLIFHGDADKVVPFENARRFDRLMKQAENMSTLVPFPGKGHGFFNNQRAGKQPQSDFDATLQESIEFLVTQGFIADAPKTLQK